MPPPRNFLLPEFDHEMAVTRDLLSRLPDARLDWAPHSRSFSLGGLASHLAELPRWGRAILDQDRHDLAEGGGRPRDPLPSREAVLARFDDHVADVRERLVAMTDAELGAPWALTRGSASLMSMPRYSAFRRFLLDHLIHHRGQLTVYLRLCDVPLPALYGPSADEQP